MRYLLVPGNNSPSHVAKCLALQAVLCARGHEARVAVSAASAGRFPGLEGCLLPDIQESDGAGYPTPEWFRDPRRLAACVQAEVELLRAWRPDRVLGVFRFTLRASAAIAGIPYDSLACGCMLPEFPGVLGFAPADPGREQQRAALEAFFRYAGARASSALAHLCAPVADIREMLKGERTFLWDFPEFEPLPPAPGVIHVGPITWPHPAGPGPELDALLANPRPLAIIASGTCVGSAAMVARMVRILRRLDYQVLVAAGGQADLLAGLAPEPQVTVLKFPPLAALLGRAALLVSHGGQMTIFEALARRVPVLVAPFQPEQAQNGVCLERLGCGARLSGPAVYLGHPGVFSRALARETDAGIERRLEALLLDPRTGERLALAQARIQRTGGVEELADRMESP